MPMSYAVCLKVRAQGYDSQGQFPWSFPDYGGQVLASEILSDRLPYFSWRKAASFAPAWRRGEPSTGAMLSGWLRADSSVFCRRAVIGRSVSIGLFPLERPLVNTRSLPDREHRGETTALDFYGPTARPRGSVEPGLVGRSFLPGG